MPSPLTLWLRRRRFDKIHNSRHDLPYRLRYSQFLIPTTLLIKLKTDRLSAAAPATGAAGGVPCLYRKFAILTAILHACYAAILPARRQLAHRGKKLNEFLLGQIENTFAPSTVMKWYSELISNKYNSTGENQKKRGRKPVNEEIVREARLANRNPTWGYDRIAGVMKYLGYDVSATTVRTSLMLTASFPIRNVDGVEIGFGLLKRQYVTAKNRLCPC